MYEQSNNQFVDFHFWHSTIIEFVHDCERKDLSFRPGAEYIFMSIITSTLMMDEYEYIAKS